MPDIDQSNSNSITLFFVRAWEGNSVSERLHDWCEATQPASSRLASELESDSFTAPGNL